MTYETIQEIEARKAEIAAILAGDTADVDLDALASEMDDIDARRAEIENDIEKRTALEARVLTEGIPMTITLNNEEPEVRADLASPEFRSAYWKTMAGEELTAAEERAYTHTTDNYGGALPVETVAGIWSLIEESHPIVSDITIYRTGTVLELTKHTSIAAGDAATVAEGVANDDEQNVFAKVTLSGKDFSKHVEISYALDFMTAGALEAYLTKEIADRLGAALAADIVAEINTGVAAGNKKATDAGVALSWGDVAAAFGLLDGVGAPTVYTRSATLYNSLVSMVDGEGRPLFQVSMQEGARGALLGAPVKVEDAVAANTILIGDPNAVVGNMVKDIMIEEDRDIKRHVRIFSGYARFECELMVDTGFVVLTVTPSV